jgi:unconventional prefoldin RPB5 interactor 1
MPSSFNFLVLPKPLSHSSSGQLSNMDDSGMAQVELQRKELEQNISKLRRSLQHWQTWEIEYEGLREEIASLPSGSNSKDVLAIARDFGAELVDDKELQMIVRDGSCPRTQAQVVDLLAKRLDYVSRNTRSIEKQLSDAQRKRNALLLAQEPDYRDDAALPLTDITEELDYEGNILSTKLETPASTAPQLLEVLKKAGVKDLVEQDGIVTAAKKPSNGSEGRQIEVPWEWNQVTKRATNDEAAISEHLITSHVNEERQVGNDSMVNNYQSERKKDAQEEDTRSYKTLATGRLESTDDLSTYASIGSVPTDSRTTEAAIMEEDEDQLIAIGNPDDTPEEAALRREMVQYGLGEVGAIVAELELEDNGSVISYDEDQAALSLDSDFDDDLDLEDESEDEHGMVKNPVMSRKYLEKMKELEEKHGIKGMQNLGPDTTRLPKEIQNELGKLPAAEATRKATLARMAESKAASKSTTIQREKGPRKPQKKVAFADDLDIAPETTSKLLTDVPKCRPGGLSLVDPVKDSIVERQASSKPVAIRQSIDPATSKKPSKFKAAREATPQTPLLPPSPTSILLPQPPKKGPQSSVPPHKIHAESIIERDITTKPTAPDSDDVDEAIHRQEIAGEYYKLRNRMIQRQGGFVGDGEADNYGEEITPLPMIDEDGRERKISRFKAARLK